MKKNVFRLSALLLCGALALTACKKKSDATPDDSSTQTTTAQDQTDYARESNQTASDADVALSASSSSGARQATAAFSLTAVQGATIDTTDLIAKSRFVIIYDGIHKTGAGTVRTGWDSVWIVPAGAKWHTAGTKLILKYEYTVTRFSGKTLVFQGTDTVTNVNGGNYAQLLEGTVKSYITNHVGGANLTFDDGKQRKWWHTRNKTATYSNSTSSFTISVAGDTVNGTNNIDTWGENRNGETFYAEITTPIEWVINPASCSHWFDPVNGVIFHKGTGSGLTVTYGIDASGHTYNPINDCPYGYKLDWTYNSKSEELIISY